MNVNVNDQAIVYHQECMSHHSCAPGTIDTNKFIVEKRSWYLWAKLDLEYFVSELFNTSY